MNDIDINAIIADIRAKLDELERAVAPQEPQEPVEFEQQSDDEVMAGIPKVPKAPRGIQAA